MPTSIGTPTLSPEERIRQAAALLAVGAIRHAAEPAGEKIDIMDVENDRDKDIVVSPESQLPPEKQAV